MRRKSLFLLLIAPLLLILLLTQLADAQAARPQQADPTPVATDAPFEEPAAPSAAATLEAGVPFTQPFLIRIRQQIPITVVLSLLRAVTVTATPTSEAAVEPTPTVRATPTARATPTVPATPTETATAVSESVEVTPSLTLTAGDAITGATVITGLLPLTSALPLTAPAAAIQLTLTAELTSPDLAVVSTVELTLPESTAAVGDLVPLTGTLPLTGVLPLTGTLPLTAALAITEPLSLLPTDVLTTVPPLFDGVPITIDMDLQFFITDTLTSTVPALMVLTFSGMPSMTFPVSITVNAPSTALVSVLPVTSTVFPVTPTATLTESAVVTLTPTVTGTGAVTATLEPTPTATPFDITSLNIVTVTVPVTANIRVAPELDAEIAQTVPGGTVLSVAAQNAAGDWLLLIDGNWIAVVVFGAAPPDLATANDAIEALLREAAANAPPTPTPLPPTPTPTPTATPTLPPFTPANVTATTNANLRAGPGTTFDIVGNTAVGQVLVITARDATGGWLRIDSGNWIAVQLVNGLPAIETIPVFDPNATPTPAPTPAAVAIPTATSPAATTPVTETTSLTGTPAAPLLPTPTPAAAVLTPVPTATAPAATLSVDENVYLVEFDNIVANYQRALTAIDRLVTSANGNTAVFDDQQWLTDMNTAIQLLRNAGPAVARLSVPDRFAAAQNSLASAVTQYNQAADLLSAGVAARSTAQFDDAFSAIALGDASVAQASAALSAFRP